MPGKALYQSLRLLGSSKEALLCTNTQHIQRSLSSLHDTKKEEHPSSRSVNLPAENRSCISPQKIFVGRVYSSTRGCVQQQP